MRSWDKDETTSDNFPTLPVRRQWTGIIFILAITIIFALAIIVIVVIQGRKRDRDSVSGATVGKAVTEGLDRTPIILSEPTLRIWTANADEYEYLELRNTEERENNMFLLMKDIYCSDTPFAKELVERYKITSNNIECKEY